jgi:DNA polymerase
MLIKCPCNKSECPVFAKCCKLPTELDYGGAETISVLFVGQGGGRTERIKGRPFIGQAGTRLRAIVAEIRKKASQPFGVAYGNTIRDNPEDNRVPTKQEFDLCIPFLFSDIVLLKEKGLKVIMPLGNSSKRFLVKEATPPMDVDHGKMYHMENEVIGRMPVIPSYHPSAIVRQKRVFESNKLSPYEVKFVQDLVFALKYLD